MPARKTKKKAARRRRPTAAETRDKYDLYENSVQDPVADCDFVDQAWRERHGRTPHLLREDFCGTAYTAAGWVKRRPKNVAYAVDIDPVVLGEAHRRCARRLKKSQRERLTVLEGDVKTAKTPPVETVLALNFSYFLFKTRDSMREYFEAARKALKPGGLFILDAYGGSDAFREIAEKRKEGDFTYVWDQSYYNPVTGDVINHIHFRFPDGSKLKRAFTYEWRLWSLPELRELLLEAGFRDVTVYWEGTDDKTGDGNGEWAVTLRGEACEGWIAYLVAER